MVKSAPLTNGKPASKKASPIKKAVKKTLSKKSAPKKAVAKKSPKKTSVAKQPTQMWDFFDHDAKYKKL